MRDKILTDRLILRKFEADDLKAVAAYAGDYEVARATGQLPHPYTIADAQAWLGYTSTQAAGDHIYAVTDLAHHCLGCISLMSKAGNTAESLELGYWLGKEHWHKGYMREASTALLDAARESLAPIDLRACVFIDNPRSLALLEYLGFKQTSLCSEFCVARGHDVEAHHLALSLDAR